MTEAEYRVRCPSCAESFAVDAAMRDDLLAAGCVLCGAPLSEADFVPLSGSSSTS
ncbi:zinc ribbon domain-containing protein (plasmid) [Halarchaeum sp. CBA1220]|nr:MULTISPECIES: zinc ribbon domain-containing protein [Halarchaeum]QLC35309.1 zinc ribbon domain-containing protein [Halarchaeum sp. CBA1220]